MKRAATNRAIQEQIAVRRAYWEGSVVADYDPARISLFGIDPIEQSEIYLVWGRAGAEPKVARYSDQHEETFANLLKYVEFVLGL